MYNEITVVIVTFNSDYDVLNRCINSIEDNIQIIIVDNSSNLESQNIENYKMKKIKIIKNEWCVPGPAGVARPTEAGRPVFSCVMRWPRRPAASKIRLPGWAAVPRLGRAAKVAKCKNEKK